MSERISLAEFRELLKGNVKQRKKTSNRFSRKASNVEPPVELLPSRSNAHQAFDSQVNITFIHYRRRLADPDGISCKAAIDGLVAIGLLKNDSAKEVGEVRQRQIKIKPNEEEKTEIIIEVIQPEGRLI